MVYTLMSGLRVVLGAFGEGAQGNLQVGSYQVGTLQKAYASKAYVVMWRPGDT